MKNSLLIATMVISTFAINAQTEWAVCNSPTTANLQAVFMPEANKVLIGGESGTLLMSTNQGSTFNFISLNSSEDIHAIYFFNSLNGIMLLGSDFMKSFDGGYTWNFISGVPGNAKGFYFLNPDTGFVACDLGEAYSTYNGGQSWNFLSTGITERLDAVYFKNINDGFFGGRNSTSLRTMDQGQSFSTDVIPANGDIKDIQFVNETFGYSCGDNGEVLFTDDGGNTWNQQITPSNNPDMNALHFTDALNGWCSGEAGNIFHTITGGTTWFNDMSNTLDEISNIHLIDNTQGFAVGDNGTIIRLGELATAINEESPENSLPLKVYPNPASGEFTVSSSSFNIGDEISVLDISGKEILKTKMDQANIQFNSETLNLVPGMYLCKIVSEGNIHTVKLLIQ